MAETFVRFSRDRTFQLITPKEFLHIWDVDHQLSASDQELLREGYWLSFLGWSTTPELRLMSNNAFAVSGDNVSVNPKMVFVDADRPDVDFAGKLPIIMGFGWIGRTTIRTTADIVGGDMLTVDVGTGSDATGDYGHLRKAANGEVVVAHAVCADSTWVTFEAVPPYAAVVA